MLKRLASRVRGGGQYGGGGGGGGAAAGNLNLEAGVAGAGIGRAGGSFGAAALVGGGTVGASTIVGGGGNGGGGGGGGGVAEESFGFSEISTIALLPANAFSADLVRGFAPRLVDALDEVRSRDDVAHRDGLAQPLKRGTANRCSARCLALTCHIRMASLNN